MRTLLLVNAAMSGAVAAAAENNFRTFKEVLITRRGALLIVQFNRANVQNALRRRTVYELMRALDMANTDSEISMVVLKGNATAFTTGNDLRELVALQAKSGDEALDAHFRTSTVVMKTLIKKILLNRKVIIALVQGNCAGLGVVICALCDIVYATESAQFWLPFSQLGLCAEGGTSATLAQLLGRSKAAELLLFGERLDAQTALRLGMVASLVTDEPDFWQRMEQHSRLPSIAMLTTKRLLQLPWRQQVLDVAVDECDELDTLRLGPAYKSHIKAFATHKRLSKL